MEGRRLSRVADSLTKLPASAWLLLGSSLFVQLGLLPASGYERDLYWFETWAHAAEMHGVTRLSEHVWCDYPPGYLYVLRGIAWLWQLFTGAELPPVGSVALRVLVKLPAVIAALLTAALLYRVAVPVLGRTGRLWVLGAYALNPALLFVGPFWGQAEAVTALLLFAAVLLVLRARADWGFALFAGAVLVKFQAVVILPILLLAAHHVSGWAGIRAALRGGAAATLVLLLPFFWDQRVYSIVEVALGAVGRYPQVSMNAHNVWWLVFGESAPEVSDLYRVGALMVSYKTLGLAMFCIATALVLWRLCAELRTGAVAVPLAVYEACALELIAFYLFPTEMHERYIVPALVFLAAAAVFHRGTRVLYVLLSFAVLISLATTLNAAYPDSLGALSALFPAGREDAMVASVLMVSLFAVLLFGRAEKRFRVRAAAVGAALTGVLALALQIPGASTQPLSEWPPVASQQDWGEPRVDYSVEGNRLAVGGMVFRRGYGAHANGQLRFHLNGVFRQFETGFGIDDTANRGQHIRFRIHVDEELRFDSGVVSGHRLPGYARVDVAGADTLTLEVLDGGDGINSDHGDWIHPLLLR